MVGKEKYVQESRMEFFQSFGFEPFWQKHWDLWNHKSPSSFMSIWVQVQGSSPSAAELKIKSTKKLNWQQYWKKLWCNCWSTGKSLDIHNNSSGDFLEILFKAGKAKSVYFQWAHFFYSGRKNYPELEIKKKDGAGVYDRGWIKSRLYSRFIFGQMHHYSSLPSVVHILD